MKPLVAIAVLLFLAACSSRPPQTPEGTYRAFHRALEDKDWDRAMTYLAPDVVDRFRETGRRLMRLRGRKGVDPLEYYLMLIPSASVASLRSVTVESRQEGLVELKVVAETKKDTYTERRLRVRRHQDRWVLDPELPALLRRPAGTTEGEGG